MINLNETSKTNKIGTVFNVKPLNNSSNAIIKYQGTMDTTDVVKDEPIMCNEDDENKYVYNISEKVYARFYKSMITGNYLMTNRILPVLYCSIMYHDTIVKGFLLNVCIEFEIKTKIVSENDLINKKLEGKYKISIHKDENYYQLDNQINKPKYIDLDNFTTEEIIIETLKSLINTPDMKELIKEMMNVRRLERIEKYGSITDYEIPKPSYNFNKLVEQYSQNN